jgi:hypothetical protein
VKLRLFLAAAASLVAAFARAQAPEVKVGQPFPALLLPSLADGSPISVESFRGRKLLLHQFASW